MLNFQGKRKMESDDDVSARAELWKALKRLPVDSDQLEIMKNSIESIDATEARRQLKELQDGLDLINEALNPKIETIK